MSESLSNSRDELYCLPRERVGDFAFDDAVADVFPDMIARSVPGYGSILSMIEQLAARFAQPGSHVYDLGCSLGAATLLMRPRLHASCRLIAIDNSPAMVARLESKLSECVNSTVKQCDVELLLADVRDLPIAHASFVVLNWTLQFIPPEQRQSLINAIFDGMLPGGALLLSEKVCFEHTGQQELLSGLHHDFKRAHGYSELEISQKRTALEKTLVPESLTAHCQRLAIAGFSVVAPWFQCFNFVSILAVKHVSRPK